MTAPATARFCKSHEWILSDLAIAPVGISHHAQAELGDVVYVELPTVGRVVKAGESFAVIESVKAASDIYAPVSGEVVEVNTALSSDTSLVNSDPYGAGWLCKIKVSDTTEVSALMDEAAYLALVG
jgi:glycine cleavage system H protein